MSKTKSTLVVILFTRKCIGDIVLSGVYLARNVVRREKTQAHTHKQEPTATQHREDKGQHILGNHARERSHGLDTSDDLLMQPMI